MTKTRSVRSSIRVLCVLVAMALAPIHASAQECLIHTVDYNRDRYVFGSVNTECTGPFHTVPFGNWGVESNHGSQYDGFQFRGWKYLGGSWLQWNSCTNQYPPPNCNYYNNPASCTTQIDYVQREYAQWWSDYLPATMGQLSLSEGADMRSARPSAIGNTGETS